MSICSLINSINQFRTTHVQVNSLAQGGIRIEQKYVFSDYDFRARIDVFDRILGPQPLQQAHDHAGDWNEPEVNQLSIN